MRGVDEQNVLRLQVSGYSSLPATLPSHPNGTYNTIATTYGTQLAHHNYPGLQTTIASLPTGPSYSSTSYSLGTIGSAAQSVLPYSSVQSTYTTTGATYSTVGSSFTTSGISSGILFIIYTSCSIGDKRITQIRQVTRITRCMNNCRHIFEWLTSNVVGPAASHNATAKRPIASESIAPASDNTANPAELEIHIASNGIWNCQSSLLGPSTNAKDTWRWNINKPPRSIDQREHFD